MATSHNDLLSAISNLASISSVTGGTQTSRSHGSAPPSRMSTAGSSDRRSRSSLARPSRAKAVPAGGVEGGPGRRKRRRRETKEELAEMYAHFCTRLPQDPTVENMAAEFADKELRVIMSQNGVLINEFDAATGRYTEKTKLQKIEAVLAMKRKGILAHPTVLDPCKKLSIKNESGGAVVGMTLAGELRPAALELPVPDPMLGSGPPTTTARGVTRPPPLVLKTPVAADIEKHLASAPVSPLTEISARIPAVTKKEEADVLDLLQSLVTVANDSSPHPTVVL
eukprot:COSAG01_NODE_2459_length_7655_cov_138.985442_9_plen_282_part_00